MCQCTPSLRTPFCGKPGCGPVRQEAKAEPAAAIHGMDFGKALHRLRNGFQMARAGWNGKGMFLTQVGGTDWGARIDCDLPQGCQLRSFIAMKAADNTFGPWQPSQADMQADDWVQVEV